MRKTDVKAEARAGMRRVERASRRALDIERAARLGAQAMAMPEGRSKRRLMAQVDRLIALMQASPL